MRRSNRNGHNISSIQKLKVRSLARAVTLSERKGSFIEDDMPRDDDSICGEIKAAVSFMVSGIAKEDTHGRTGSEFMGSSGGEVWVTLAAENPKMIIRRRFDQKGEVWRGEVEGLGWQDVNQRGRRGEGLNLVGGGHGCLKQQGANDIIYGVNNTFGFTILRRSIRARHEKMDALSEKESVGT